jgi:two-component system NtrC family sensor kinase
VEKSTVLINDILQKTLIFFSFQLKTKNIMLVERYDECVPFIMGNATHLHQVFLNILLNASEAMSDGGKLRVTTKSHTIKADKKTKKVVEISIIDTGRGIDNKCLDKIFDPFFTVNQDGRGTGLGLSISYGIIKEHQGTIDVKSVPGKGTSVKITLPALDRES